MDVVTVRENGTKRVAVSFPEDESIMRKGKKLYISRSRAKQSFAKEADINNIMSRYRKTGLVPAIGGNPFYGDFSGAVDFGSTISKITKAKEAFSLLPADIRKRFDNDPSVLIEFVANEVNYEEAVKLGILAKDPVKEEAKRVAAEAAHAERMKAEKAKAGST